MTKVTININELIKKKTLRDGRDPKLNPITQLEVAEGSGVPASTVSRWAGNRVDRIDLGNLVLLCKYFECAVGDLLVIEDM